MAKNKVKHLDAAGICQAYREGSKSLDSLAAESKVCRNTITKLIRCNGGTIKPRGGSNRKWCEKERQKLKELYDSGMSVSEIARKTNTKFHTMRKRLIKYGVKK